MAEIVVPGVDPVDARSLIEQWARSALSSAAPDELVLFEELSSEYFADPDAAVGTGSKDVPVGFGIELALLTPYVLLAVTAVVQFVGSVMKDAVKGELSNALKGWMRRLRGGKESTSPEPALLSSQQLAKLHQVALQSVERVGLAAGTAALVADAVVGAMARSGE